MVQRDFRKQVIFAVFLALMIFQWDARADGAVGYSFHVGAGGYFEIGTPAGAGGIYAAGEAAGWDEVSFSNDSHHLVIGDGRLMVALVFGRGTDANGEGTNLFALRLEGSAAFGLQAYRVIPLNISLEDGTYVKTNLDSRGTALLGTTVYLPVNLARTEEEGGNKVLFLALTAGARWNSELHDGAVFGIQPKVRFMSDDFSAELRYLMSLGTPEAEKKVAVYFAYRNLFRSGDEIGISFSNTWTDQTGSEWNRGPEVFVFYGVNR